MSHLTNWFHLKFALFHHWYNHQYDQVFVVHAVIAHTLQAAISYHVQFQLHTIIFGVSHEPYVFVEIFICQAAVQVENGSNVVQPSHEYQLEHVYVQFHGVILYTQACHTRVGLHIVVVHICAYDGVTAHEFNGILVVVFVLLKTTGLLPLRIVRFHNANNHASVVVFITSAIFQLLESVVHV